MSDQQKPKATVIGHPDGSITIKYDGKYVSGQTTYRPDGTRIDQISDDTGVKIIITPGKKGSDKR